MRKVKLFKFSILNTNIRIIWNFHTNWNSEWCLCTSVTTNGFLDIWNYGFLELLWKIHMQTKIKTWDCFNFVQWKYLVCSTSRRCFFYFFMYIIFNFFSFSCFICGNNSQKLNRLTFYWKCLNESRMIQFVSVICLQFVTYVA